MPRLYAAPQNLNLGISQPHWDNHGLNRARGRALITGRRGGAPFTRIQKDSRVSCLTDGQKDNFILNSMRDGGRKHEWGSTDDE